MLIYSNDSRTIFGNKDFFMRDSPAAGFKTFLFLSSQNKYWKHNDVRQIFNDQVTVYLNIKMI